MSTTESIGSRVTFRELFDRDQHGLVQIPIIQRDYAQGRATEKEVRNAFLDAIYRALDRPVSDTLLPLDLDFVYGSIERDAGVAFCPLDGQQRLTTLFLLHWYLSCLDEEFESFQSFLTKNDKSRFSYAVRPSSSEFFDEISMWNLISDWKQQYRSVKDAIEDQPWFFQWWKRDPTITSALNMLNAIDDKFNQTEGFYGRIVNTERPYITFQLLDLANFGLSDDLYIKMNARGKPLTAFEVFKARLEGQLVSVFGGVSKKLHGKQVSVKDYFSHKIDTKWADLLWKYRDWFDLFDDEVMNLVRALAIGTREPDLPNFEECVAELRDADSVSFQRYLDLGCLDRDHLDQLILVLDHFSGGESDAFTRLLAQEQFDEEKSFERILNEGGGASYRSLLQFYAYIGFVQQHPTDDGVGLREWMRIIINLTTNSNIERPEEFRNGLRSINSLLNNSANILEHFAEKKAKIQGFSVQQIQEERVKASLILRDSKWRELISNAESHGYFKGQIEFLLDFCGVLEAWRLSPSCAWNDTENKKYLKRFDDYLKKASALFSNGGLKAYGTFRTERALLAIGDYMLEQRPNYSFLENSESSSYSWKRLLRGDLNDPGEGRGFVKDLMTRMSGTVGVAGLLDDVINTVVADDEWRQFFVSNPSLIGYCTKRQIRFNDPHNIFLLRGQRRNGEHVELYTYHLFKAMLSPKHADGKLEPFTQSNYRPVNTDEVVPSILLGGTVNGTHVSLTIWNLGTSNFRFKMQSKDAKIRDGLLKSLKGVDENTAVIVDIELDVDMAVKLVEKICRHLKKQIIPT